MTSCSSRVTFCASDGHQASSCLHPIFWTSPSWLFIHQLSLNHRQRWQLRYLNPASGVTRFSLPSYQAAAFQNKCHSPVLCPLVFCPLKVNKDKVRTSWSLLWIWNRSDTGPFKDSALYTASLMTKLNRWQSLGSIKPPVCSNLPERKRNKLQVFLHFKTLLISVPE